MKLLIVTQVVDINHPELGFFHRWIIEFAKHFESIQVIALYVGSHDLPENVEVFSLGKESGSTKVSRVIDFYRHAWGLRNKYDAVYVHMNPEYIVLFGFLWKLAQKKVVLWYNHTVGSFALRVSALFIDVHMHTSPYAYPARYKDAMQMPAGIDTELFTPQKEIIRKPNSIYFQGRVSKAKRVHVLLEVFDLLIKQGGKRTLTIAGPEDALYIEPLKEKYASYIHDGILSLLGPQKHSETPKLYAAHSVSVNLTDDGNYDKTVLESLACGTPVVTSSKAFADAPIILCDAPHAHLVAEALMKTSVNEEDLVAYVREKHSLKTLASSIKTVYSK